MPRLASPRIHLRLLQHSIRHASTSTSTSGGPPPAVSRWLADITSRPAELSVDHLDPLRAAQLQRTLPTRVALPTSTGLPLALPRADVGDELPRGHHLAYFQPESLLGDLAEDGSSLEYNAPAPYLRRMWAGGSFTFSPDPSRALRIGQHVVQRLSVPRADFKAGMIFVQQQRDLYSIRVGTTGRVGVPRLEVLEELARDKDGWGVREVRTHVFRSEVGTNDQIRAKAKAAAASAPLLPSAPSPYDVSYTPTAPLLFRYSALTHNAHRIHYDRDWARAVEGHPDLVVHGPLTATLLLELAEGVARASRHAQAGAGAGAGRGGGGGRVGEGKGDPSPGLRVRRFEYRATSPMYVDGPIRLAAGQVERVDLASMEWARAGGAGGVGGAGGTTGLGEADGWRCELGAEQDGRVGMRATAYIG